MLKMKIQISLGLEERPIQTDQYVRYRVGIDHRLQLFLTVVQEGLSNRISDTS